MTNTNQDLHGESEFFALDSYIIALVQQTGEHRALK